MISFLSNFIAHYLFKNQIIEKEKVPVCQYGFEIIVSTFMGFLIVSVIGIVLNEFAEALLFYFLFVIVRMFTGGYHAETHFKCKLTLSVCCLSVLILSKYYIYFEKAYIFLLIPYLITVCLFAPVEHINAPLNDNKTRNRVVSIIMAILLAISNLVIYSYMPKLVTVSSLTLFIIAMLIIISKIKERRCFYEKSKKKFLILELN